MEHFFHNQHGELDAIIAGLASLPFIGAWISSRLSGRHNKAKP